MIVKLYLNHSEKNRVKKTLTDIASIEGSITGFMREDMSIISPRLELRVPFETIIKANYIYIPDFNRYYFINDMTQRSGALTEITTNCDVLMSFADEILENTAVIARQENIYNRYLNDDRFKVYQNYSTTTHLFDGENPAIFPPAFVLTTAGKSVVESE